MNFDASKLTIFLVRLAAMQSFLGGLDYLTYLPQHIWQASHSSSFVSGELTNIETRLLFVRFGMHAAIAALLWLYALPIAKSLSVGLGFNLGE
jgi:hypothetical protein